MSFYYPTSSFDLSGKTLVVPIVSIANIGQLAVDLLVSSLSLRAIGIFDSRDLIPVVGGREDGEEGVTTPLELFGKDGCSTVVIQQRSPILVSRKQEFINSLLKFIHESKFSAVVFLSGVDLSNRTDAQMLYIVFVLLEACAMLTEPRTPTYYIQPANSPAWENSPFSSISQLPIPKYTSPVPQHPGAAQNEGPIPFIPGGGLTRRILSSLPETWSVPTISILQFVLEGDNRYDASLLAAVAAKVLSLQIPEWKQPSSWRQGLFGTPHDQTLYG
ncbi:PAC2 family-domain-containing protein [Gloeopeniophorella convolvens]|nr:PAC2 family-domain-containing protein [Gloeopeniophorella convolvens]